MDIQRIQWAGMLIKMRKVKIMIDPIFNSASPYLFGTPREKFYPLHEFECPDVIAITHLHSDHFDPFSIIATYGDEIPTFVPAACIEEAKKAGLKNLIGMSEWETVDIHGVELIAAPSVDGLGDPQTAWIIRGEGKTMIHCGDTLWHGNWWKINEKYGPMDVAFMPINGALIKEEGMVASEQPICLGPEQAVSAAKILKAENLIPIHFGAFHNPPSYTETPNSIQRLRESISSTDIRLNILKNKDTVLI